MDGMAQVYMTGLFIAFLFYVFLILPQQLDGKKRNRELSSIAAGDLVVTVGGLVGKVTQTFERRLQIEVAPGIEVTVVRSMVLRRLTAEEAVQGDVASRLGALVPDATVKALTREVETPAKLQG
jgi:preprotein translocase subunit YajC